MSWEPLPNTMVGAYTLQDELGRGGFGAVWRATTADGVDVAIKFLRKPPHGIAARRFAREMVVLGHLDHPNCAKLLATGEVDGVPYLVMELVRGFQMHGDRRHRRHRNHRGSHTTLAEHLHDSSCAGACAADCADPHR